jgi:LuxR family maltose regulon positive regulatory protein
LAQGFSNKEIGRVMGVSSNTVKYHLKQIYGELHVHNRARAVSQARMLGIIDD